MAGYLIQGAAAIGGLTALGAYAGYEDYKTYQKRKERGFRVVEPSTKRIRFTKKSLRNPKMAFRRRGRFRRRFSRRGKKYVRRARARRFRRRVRRIVLKTHEPQKFVAATVAGYSIREGDGTSRVTNVMCPLFAMRQGNEEDQFAGNSFWCKGIALRGQVGTSGESTSNQGAVITVTLVWSKEQNPQAFTGQWTELTSTTTSTTNPTATAPNLNPRFFADSTNPLPFVGLGNVIEFDSTRVKVGKQYKILVNPGVENQAGASVIACPTEFRMWFPINKKFTLEDPEQSDFSATALRFKQWVPYIVMQAVSDTDQVANEVIAEMDYRTVVAHREI